MDGEKSASRLDGGEGGQFRRKGVRRVGGKIEAEEGSAGDGKGGLAFATVDQHRDADGRSAQSSHDLEGFPDPTAAGDDIFHEEDFFAGMNDEIPPQGEPTGAIGSGFLFGEEKTRARLAGHFLTDHETAHGRSQDRRKIPGWQPLQQHFSQAGDPVHPFANPRALEKMPAVQTAPQDKMSAQESPRILEYLEYFFILMSHATIKENIRRRTRRKGGRRRK